MDSNSVSNHMNDKIWHEDGMKSCYHLIKTMTKLEKKTRHWFYIFIDKQNA